MHLAGWVLSTYRWVAKPLATPKQSEPRSTLFLCSNLYRSRV